MAETMALRAGDGTTGPTTLLGDYDLRRWGDDAVMTEGERDEWRRRHAKAAPACAMGKLPKAGKATAPPPAKKLVTPPSSVGDPDEVVVADEPVLAPKGVIVSDGSDSDEGLAHGRAALGLAGTLVVHDALALRCKQCAQVHAASPDERPVVSV